jgi:hypothetical protein
MSLAAFPGSPDNGALHILHQCAVQFDRKNFLPCSQDAETAAAMRAAGLRLMKHWA